MSNSNGLMDYLFNANKDKNKDYSYIPEIEDAKRNCKHIHDCLDLVSNDQATKMIYSLNTVGFIYQKQMINFGVHPQTVQNLIVKFIDLGIIELTNLTPEENSYFYEVKKYSSYNLTQIRIFKFSDFGKDFFTNDNIFNVIESRVSSHIKTTIETEVNEISKFKKAEELRKNKQKTEITDTGKKNTVSDISLMSEAEKLEFLNSALFS